MHEIRATIPPEIVSEVIRLATDAGIDRVTVAEVFVHGPNVSRRTLSVETSTPQARAFVDALLHCPSLLGAECSLTSREVRSIVDPQNVSTVTQPMSEPFPDIVQDLWQLSHLTPSYLGRAGAGAVLLASGIIENSAISIVVAALFLPYLSQVLALSLGVWSADRRLIGQGAKALAASTLLAFASGALVGWIEGGPIRFEAFRNPLGSLAISVVIGAAAGLSIADDTGRRYLIGVAAAVQLAIFPVWLGAAVVLGMPPAKIVEQRVLAFAVNLLSITVAALVAYSALHLRKGARLSALKK